MSFAIRKSKFAGVKLLVAIDVGTTFTAASYCLLDRKGNPLKLQEVNRWPKQVSGDAKVPSVLYYDQNNVPILHGAETEDEDCLIDAEDFCWQKAAWWKLLLRPDHLPLPDGFITPALPPGLTVDNVFRDHFTFVKRDIRDFIIKCHGYSEREMNDLELASELILTTPNGWEGRHHHRIRMAALDAGVLPRDQGHRIKFVSEGEVSHTFSILTDHHHHHPDVVLKKCLLQAAIHYALDNKHVSYSDKFRVNNVILVCDAGGGTTDIGVYKIKSLHPVAVDEVCSPGCYVAGGTFVNERAKDFITAQVKGTPWDQPTYIASAMSEFERSAKRKFQGVESFAFVKLAGSTQSNEAKGITRGRLRVSCATMASFFDPFIEIVIQALEESMSGQIVNHIVLVGGFAESDYVFFQLNKWATSKHISIGKPDGIASKAIAHGSLSWLIRSAVQLRIAKFHYGAETDAVYDSHDRAMSGRRRFHNILGETRVRYIWKSIVSKGAKLEPKAELYIEFHRNFDGNELGIVEIDIFAYRWEDPPMFFRNTGGHLEDGFIQIGTVKADLKSCLDAASYQISPIEKLYKRLDYEVCLCFDEIEIRARLRWKENGIYKYGPATVAYDI